jgi:hypothetical protein
MLKAIDQHKLAESLLDRPTAEIQSYGTRWAPFDIADWMLKHEPDLDYFCLSIYRPDGSPIWASRFPIHEVAKLRLKYGPAMFALQYENRALAEGVTEFREEWLRYWYMETRVEHGRPTEYITIERPQSEGGKKSYRLSDLERCQAVDPCHNPESGDARTANVIVGLTNDEPFNIIVLEAHAEKVTPKTSIDKSYESFKRWGCSTAGVEIVGAQRTFYYWAVATYPGYPLRRFKTDTHTRKQTRIRPMGSFGEQGRVYIHRSMGDFIEEWDTFPNGQTVDLLDAFAYLPQLWCAPDADEEPREPKLLDLEDEDEVEEYIGQQGRNRVTGY